MVIPKVFFFFFLYVYTIGGEGIRISDLRFMRRGLQLIELLFGDNNSKSHISFEKTKKKFF
jgi:hypothetical protein